MRAIPEMKYQENIPTFASKHSYHRYTCYTMKQSKSGKVVDKGRGNSCTPDFTVFKRFTRYNNKQLNLET